MPTSWIYGAGQPPSGGQRQVVNLKTDFGAAGNGGTDDTNAIQNALTACFGSFSSPNTDATQNKTLFIPSGNYLVTKPIYLSSAGGRIICEGVGTQFFYAWDGVTTETVSGDNTPSLLVCDGLRNMVIEGLALTMQRNHHTNPPSGMYILQTGARGVTGNNVFYNMSYDSFYYGVLIKGTQGCANNMWIGASLGRNYLSGIRVDNPESLNNMWFGGGAGNNAVGGTARPDLGSSGNLGAAYAIIQGSLHMTNLSNDQIDGGFLGTGFNPAIPPSGVTEPGTRAVGGGGADANEIIVNCVQGTAGWFDGSWLTVDFIDAGTTEANGTWQVVQQKYYDHPLDDVLSLQLTGSNFVHAWTTGNFSGALAYLTAAYNWDIVCAAHGTVMGAKAEGNHDIVLAGTSPSLVVDGYEPTGNKSVLFDLQLSTNGTLISRGSIWGFNGTPNQGTTGRTVGDCYVAKLGSSGSCIMDCHFGWAFQTNGNSLLSGSAGSRLYLRNSWLPTPVQTHFATTFFGTKVEDIATQYFN